jgi:hypothetical protein
MAGPRRLARGPATSATALLALLPPTAALLALLFLAGALISPASPLSPPVAAASTQEGPPPPEAERGVAYTLARRYAPIMMLREETDPPCQTSAEQYEPTNVDAVLRKPDVTLTAYIPGRGLIAVKRAPTHRDLAGLGDEYYLDLRGKALGDTCVYARDFKRLADAHRAVPTTYAHIAREPGHPGFALQFWFFWYFNQFNDLHEGDWEGMQLTFDAPTPQAAFDRGEEPQQMILFQHAGGERADWGDDKVQKDGTHPVVYPAAGSHATFYDSAVYVQNGQNGSGLGCDTTTEPLREVEPNAVLLPNRVPRTGEFEWLSYYGRWGEREKGYNNGPQGPQTKTVWREPFSWMAAQRSTSPRLPGGSVIGPQVAGAFCGAVSAASELVNLDIKSRFALIATLAVAAILIALFVGFTRWGPVDLENLPARRSFGQLVRTARQLYGRHWRVLLPVSAIAVVIVGGINLLAALLGNSHAIGDAAGRSGVNLALGDVIESIGRPVAMAVVSAIVVVVVRLQVEGQPRPGFGAAFRGMGSRFWRVVGGRLLYYLGLYGLAITIVGIPFAINKFVAWAFVQQEILFEDRKVRPAFHASADLVRGRWWHSVRVLVFLFLVSVVTGPVLTFALIFTSLPLTWVNLLGSVIFALLIPYVALGETLLYLDLKARTETEGVKPARSWRPWRPRQFGRVRGAPAPQPAPSG